jgi:hypothetical protein
MSVPFLIAAERSSFSADFSAGSGAAVNVALANNAPPHASNINPIVLIMRRFLKPVLQRE